MTEDNKDITLESLVGLHELSGVSFDDLQPRTPLNDGYDAANRCTFILDGIAYQAIEDPADGYRSSLGSLLICDVALVQNRFEPIKVLGEISRGGGDEIINFRDVRNGMVILSIGTSDADDYYPSFVASWSPESIAEQPQPTPA